MLSGNSMIASSVAAWNTSSCACAARTVHQGRLVAFSWPLLRIHTPAALVIPFTSQAPGVLPELWGAAYGRKRGVAGQFGDTVGKVAGFSLHAGVATKVYERKKPERLCRYNTRGRASSRRRRWRRTSGRGARALVKDAAERATSVAHLYRMLA